MLTRTVRAIARLTLWKPWQDLRVNIEHRRVLLYQQSWPGMNVKRLLVSGEDHRSGRHGGFDALAMIRATWHLLAFGRREGASTIEQQLVRVLTNRFERTLQRKCREILLASLVAGSYAKSETAALYLNVAYYGWRMNNYHEACSRLRFSPSSLSLGEAAEVVARLKYPEPRIPSLKRRAQIERRVTYLLNLYQAHLGNGTYDHLGHAEAAEAFQSGAILSRAASPASPA